MKKLVVFIVLSVMMVPAIAFAEPQLTLDGRVKDFGPVKQGTVLRHDFKLTNIGDKDVIIEKLQPNWGVKAVRAGQGPIKPGETETISVSADTSGDVGKVVTGVRVFTNDPNMRNIGLVLKARVVEPPPKQEAPSSEKDPDASSD